MVELESLQGTKMWRERRREVLSGPMEVRWWWSWVGCVVEKVLCVYRMGRASAWICLQVRRIEGWRLLVLLWWWCGV